MVGWCVTGEAMIVKVGRRAEGLAAASTAPRPLPSMGAVVLLQFEQPVEYLATHHTLQAFTATTSPHFCWHLESFLSVLKPVNLLWWTLRTHVIIIINNKQRYN